MATPEELNAAVTLQEIEHNTDLPTTTSACGTVPITTTTTTDVIAATLTDSNAIAAAGGTIDLCNSPTPSTSKSGGAVATTSSSVIALDDSAGEEEEEEGEESSGVVDNSTASSTTAAGSSTIIECPICLQTCIHPARLPCGHIFCFLCVKGVAYKNRRCAMCRREIPPEFLDHPDLVNGIDDICVTKSTEDGYQWFYEGRNGWWQYDDRTSQDIEEAFKKGEKSCIILVAGYVYVVDLEAMVQQRQNEPVRCRRVKRDLATIPKKGVAGLRIEGNTVITDSNFASQVQQQQQQRNIIIGISAANTPLDPTSDFSPPLNFYSLRHPTNASDFITTIAATDAAIRIASDIIGSTLAHADELSRSTTAGGLGFGGSLTGQQNNSDDAQQQQQIFDETTGTYSGPYRPLLGIQNAAGASTSSIQGNGSVPNSSATAATIAAHARVAHGSRELLDAAEDLLDATQNIISEADQQTIDLFEQTLSDFHALTLRNIIDSDSSDEGENRNGGGGTGVGIGGISDIGGDDDVDDDSYAPRHIRF